RDVGMVAEAAAGGAAPLLAHARQGPHHLRHRLAGAVDGTLPRRSGQPRPRRRRARPIPVPQRPGVILLVNEHVYIHERIAIEGGDRGRMIEMIRSRWAAHLERRHGVRLVGVWATVGST